MHRAQELKPGGKLVLINFGTDEQGRYLGNTGGTNMFNTFNNIWQSFVDDKRISQDEYENMTLPQYYNSVEEFSAPLVKPLMNQSIRQVYGSVISIPASLNAPSPKNLNNTMMRRALPKNIFRPSVAGMRAFSITAYRPIDLPKNVVKSSKTITALINQWLKRIPKVTAWIMYMPTR